MRKIVNYVFNELDSHSFATIFTIIYFMVTLLAAILITSIVNEGYIWAIFYWLILSFILSFKVVFILNKIGGAVDKYLNS